MKTNYLTIMAAAVLSAFLACTAFADIQGSTADPGTPITKEEAAKKCPMQKGNYPMGERDNHAPSGWINSPFPPRKMYDCSKIGHGALVFDPQAKRVFTRP
jgi:hypothetical protein